MPAIEQRETDKEAKKRDIYNIYNIYIAIESQP